MLVLARSPGEKIRIGDDIEILIVSVQGHCVRVGITAPKSVRVDRQEVYEKKHAETGSPGGPPGKPKSP